MQIDDNYAPHVVSMEAEVHEVLTVYDEVMGGAAKWEKGLVCGASVGHAHCVYRHPDQAHCGVHHRGRHHGADHPKCMCVLRMGCSRCHCVVDHV